MNSYYLDDLEQRGCCQQKEPCGTDRFERHDGPEVETTCCGSGACCAQEPMEETGCCGSGACCAQEPTEPTGCGNHAHARHEKEAEAALQEGTQEFETRLLEAQDKYMRLYAEFENFRKRNAKERSAFVAQATEKALRELLPVADDFERSMAAWQPSPGEVQEAMHAGVQCIYSKLLAFLKKHGVEAMDVQPGSTFDADAHEAIMQEPAASPEMQGKISSVVEKGYLLHGSVLRCAKVVIGS